jgi:hypothetical protein
VYLAIVIDGLETLVGSILFPEVGQLGFACHRGAPPTRGLNALWEEQGLHMVKTTCLHFCTHFF